MCTINSNEYAFFEVENQMLLKASIIDLATLMGHTATEPISSHIFCLEFGFTQEEHDQILLRLNLLSDKKELSLEEVRKQLEQVVPRTSELSKDIFYGMLKIFLKQFDIPLKISDLECWEETNDF